MRQASDSIGLCFAAQTRPTYKCGESITAKRILHINRMYPLFLMVNKVMGLFLRLRGGEC